MTWPSKGNNKALLGALSHSADECAILQRLLAFYPSTSFVFCSKNRDEHYLIIWGVWSNGNTIKHGYELWITCGYKGIIGSTAFYSINQCACLSLVKQDASTRCQRLFLAGSNVWTSQAQQYTGILSVERRRMIVNISQDSAHALVVVEPKALTLYNRNAAPSDQNDIKYTVKRLMNTTQTENSSP